MAIRLRRGDGVLVALCAARSVAKPGDVYLDDATHYALTHKFAREWERWDDADMAARIEREETDPPPITGHPRPQYWYYGQRCCPTCGMNDETRVAGSSTTHWHCDRCDKPLPPEAP